MAEVAKVFSAEPQGVEAHLIEVETDIHVGLHSFTIVGLADRALSEAKERVNAAFKNSGLKPPTKENRRIVVNLAPADIEKSGSQYDLAIAVGYLLASGQLRFFSTDRVLFVGELALDGKVRSVAGILNMVHRAAHAGFSLAFVPKANAEEAAIVDGITIVPVTDLTSLIAHLEGRTVIAPQPTTRLEAQQAPHAVDFFDVKGQEGAKRALTIAAAGGHNLLMVGPPGTGKTMLAQALASVLPSPSPEEIVEITRVWSAAGLLKKEPFIGYRPFRTPHQTASPVAVIGGGQIPRPGEISLAHRGVLFLDELPEFRRDILEALRQPMESGTAVVSRAKQSVVFPAHFILVAAMNPCPCGFWGDPEKTCRCGAYEVIRYQKKLSGPLLDRIDIQITVPRVTVDRLRDRRSVGAGSEMVRSEINRARSIQETRFRRAGAKAKFVNAELSSRECDHLLTIHESAEQFLREAVSAAALSARGYYRVLKVAQTIADLEGSPILHRAHLTEAFSYRLRE